MANIENYDGAGVADIEMYCKHQISRGEKMISAYAVQRLLDEHARIRRTANEELRLQHSRESLRREILELQRTKDAMASKLLKRLR